jgi:hypothetical protein
MPSHTPTDRSSGLADGGSCHACVSDACPPRATAKGDLGDDVIRLSYRDGRHCLRRRCEYYRKASDSEHSDHSFPPSIDADWAAPALSECGRSQPCRGRPPTGTLLARALPGTGDNRVGARSVPACKNEDGPLPCLPSGPYRATQGISALTGRATLRWPGTVDKARPAKKAGTQVDQSCLSCSEDNSRAARCAVSAAAAADVNLDHQVISCGRAARHVRGRRRRARRSATSYRCDLRGRELVITNTRPRWQKRGRLARILRATG